MSDQPTDGQDLPSVPEPEPAEVTAPSDEGSEEFMDALEATAVADGTPKPKKKKGKKKKVVVQEVTPGWVQWAGAAALVIVLALALVALLESRRADDVPAKVRAQVAAEGASRLSAERVAGEFAQTLFTFEAAKPTAHLDRLKELATKAYQPKVDDARQTALAGSTGGGSQASMTSRVTDVYLTELVGNRAHAVTRSDWVLTADGQTLDLDLYLQLDLKREGGTWKVDTVSALTAKQPPGAATTSTTAPGATTSTTPTTAAP